MKLIFIFCLFLSSFMTEIQHALANNIGSENIPTETYFKQAEAVWPVGLEFEKNISVKFAGQFNAPQNKKVVLNLTGSSLYRIILNEEFVGHGPARAAHGFYRVDEIDLSEKLCSGENNIEIQVAGYNVNSYYLLDQPSFLQAELVSGEKALLATKETGGGFKVTLMKERVQKVPRYSFQRPFTEVYNLSKELKITDKELKCEKVEGKQLISRRIKFSDFEVRSPKTVLSTGTVETGIKQARYWKDRAVRNIGEKLGGFTEDELVTNPAIEIQEIKEKSRVNKTEKYESSKEIIFAENSFQILDLGLNNSGFIGAEINCTKPCKIYFTFDEILIDEDVDFKRLGCINSVTYNIEPGKYRIESFEPYTFRYMKIVVVEGECEISNVYLREYANSDITKASFLCSDERLNSIYDAGVETFKQNVVDIFMDCPSRERAGWLCDSYFSSRVASVLSGNTLVEKNFYENFLLPDKFEHLPDGMLPMCYPADHNDGVFIANWAMWFVIQLEEYLYRSGDKQMVEALKPKVLNLLKYLDGFKNSDGLLESMDSWVFVEWSDANKFVQDVNYPSNMLYSATLEIAGRLYGLPELQNEATKIKKIILEQSFNGEFFVDNATRSKNGKLKIEKNTSEVCQYYAFFFEVATPETHPVLWKKILSQFGPKRKNTGAFPNVHPANAFIGNYLRLELLSRNKEHKKILSESVGFFNYMAERTGTLWEHQLTSASCNHGFASHVVYLFYRDVLGIYDVNTVEKKISIQFADVEIESCQGQIPVGDDVISLEWKKSGDEIIYELKAPDNYKVEITNLSGRKLVKK